MSANKTVVYYNIEASGDLVFILPQKHISVGEARMMNLALSSGFQKNHTFTIKNFEANAPEVFAFVALLLEHGFVPEGHSGPFKPERGATHFWSRSNDVEAGAKRARP